MDFLHMLEKIRNPIVDNLMLAVTSFGEETALQGTIENMPE